MYLRFFFVLYMPLEIILSNMNTLGQKMKEEIALRTVYDTLTVDFNVI